MKKDSAVITSTASSATASDAVNVYARTYLAKQTQELFVPSYSAWFSFENINEIEKRALPEFFAGRNKSKVIICFSLYFYGFLDFY